jgi:hypothetical protein
VARATKCPNCGERVSAFAGGCALCGADLDEHRRRLAERPTVPDVARRVPTLPRAPLASRINPDYALVGVTVLLLLMFPLFGALLAGLGAWDRNKQGRDGLRNVFLALLGVAITFLLLPELQYGVLSLLLRGG